MNENKSNTRQIFTIINTVNTPKQKGSLKPKRKLTFDVKASTTLVLLPKDESNSESTKENSKCSSSPINTYINPPSISKFGEVYDNFMIPNFLNDKERLPESKFLHMCKEDVELYMVRGPTMSAKFYGYSEIFNENIYFDFSK